MTIYKVLKVIQMNQKDYLVLILPILILLILYFSKMKISKFKAFDNIPF